MNGDNDITKLTDLIREWAIDRNLNTADPTKQAIKLGEEFGELCSGLARGDDALVEDSIGDMYVVLTILAEQKGLDIGRCIESAYNEIKDRKGRMIDDVFVKEADLSSLGVTTERRSGGKRTQGIRDHSQ